MAFTETVGLVDAGIGIYSFVAEKFRDEHSEFVKKVKKSIKSTCKIFNENLSESHEYKGLVTNDIIEQIINNVLYCISNNKPLKIDIVPTDENMPNHMRKHLFSAVRRTLDYSIEFSIRDFQHWIEQTDGAMLHDLQIILNSTERIEAAIEKLISYIKSEQDDFSIKHSSNILMSKNRFHYTAQNTKFLGREIEVVELKKFCFNDQQILWWAVVGEGGIGKTRLAFEFMEKMKRYGWNTCVPNELTYNALYECSKTLVSDTLYLLDYSAMFIKDIGRWIGYLTRRSFPKKIRVLLIERKGFDLAESNWLLTDYIASSRVIKDTLYKEKFLLLESIKKDSLNKIMQSYALSRNIQVDENTLSALYGVLTKIDFIQKRPLFAMFITDAYIENRNPFEWNRRDALDYVFDRELDALKQRIVGICGQQKNMLQTCQKIIMMATMTDGLSCPDDLKNLMPNEYDILSQNKHDSDVEELLTDIGICSRSICSALEPDIIGEYFVLKTLSDIKTLNKAKSYITQAWTNPIKMNRFVTRTYQDFSDVLIEKNLLLLFEGITLPESVSNVGNGMFEKSKIKNVIIPDNYTAIDDFAFRDANNMANIRIPTELTSIGIGAFQGCSNLGHIKLPDTLKEIKGLQFYGCIKLESIRLPNKIEIIEPSAFRECEKLRYIEIPNNVKTIGKWAFCNCKSLRHVFLNENLKKIDNWAFEGCSSLEELFIPDSVQFIGYRTFLGCTNLHKVSLPKQHASIIDDILHYCSNYFDIKFEIRTKINK